MVAQKNDSDEKGETLTKVFEQKSDYWPTKALKKQLIKLQPEEGAAEVYLKLNEGDYDLTSETLDIEKQFRPEVIIRTRALKTELDRWHIGGGAFFRVLGNAPKEQKATKLALQYLIVWTRQLFPFQFGFLCIPFFLATVFFWQFSQKFPVTPSTPGTYLALYILGGIFLILGGYTILEGFYRRVIQRIENWKIIPDSMIGFTVPGVLFWTTALEYSIIRTRGGTSFPAIIPVSGWVSLGLGIVIALIGLDFFFRGEKSYVERFSHPNDYAPLMIYLTRDQKGDWSIEGAQFDFFHYKTIFTPKESLIFDEALPEDEKTHAKFIIDRSWHAFREHIKPNIVLRLFSHWLVVLFVFLAFVAYVFIILLAVELPYIPDWSSSYPWVFSISYVLPPLLMVFIWWAFLRTQEYKLPIWEELSEKSDEELLQFHHLDYDRLRILWNLRDREHRVERSLTSLWTKEHWIEGCKSRLVARVKLQYPFARYRFWETLRDTQEELLSIISLQTKEEELETLQKEIEEAKQKLIDQRTLLMKESKELLDEEEEEELVKEREERRRRIKSKRAW